MRSMPVIVVTGMMPGSTGLVTPSSASSSTRRVHSLGLEEELRDREVGQRQLLGEVAPVRREVRRPRVSGRVGRDADREVADLARHVDEVDRVLELRVGGRRIVRDVAAERHDVLHAGVGVVLQEVAHLGAGVADADDVGHGGHVAVALDLGDEVEGALA